MITYPTELTAINAISHKSWEAMASVASEGVETSSIFITVVRSTLVNIYNDIVTASMQQNPTLPFPQPTMTFTTFKNVSSNTFSINITL